MNPHMSIVLFLEQYITREGVRTKRGLVVYVRVVDLYEAYIDFLAKQMSSIGIGFFATRILKKLILRKTFKSILEFLGFIISRENGTSAEEITNFDKVETFINDYKTSKVKTLINDYKIEQHESEDVDEDWEL